MRIIEKVLKKYDFYKEINSYHEYGNGHINNTYLVETKSGKFILQQLNKFVFKKPNKVMKNISLVTKFLKNRTNEITLEIVKTKKKQKLIKIDNNYWRCYKCIECGRTFETLQNKNMIYEVGRIIGRFQKNLVNFPICRLSYVIKDFHNTKKRFQDFKKAIITSENKKNCQKEIDFIKSKEEIVDIIVNALSNKEIPLRVTHNDTKLNNIIIDENGKAICLIDFDTVMPGSILYDYADGLRGVITKAKEDERDLRKVKLDISMFTLFSKGFLEEVKDVITPKEISLLVTSIKIIVLECAMRFLTDYLNKNIYFKIQYPEHNLIRAKNQLKLFKEVEKNAYRLEKIIDELICEVNIFKT